MSNVVIVESPAKAKTINKYLGDDFTVIASYGHIRDLPSKDGSVRPDEDFAMTYEISDRSEKHVKAIASLVKKADHIYLATDPDREGEAISWHVLEALEERKALKKNTVVKRIVFNEITKKAVTEAVANPRDIDMDLVYAQQARRALDYLVGFTLSPVLWRKLPGSRSAGRVQSVALRLICDREQEIEQFVTQEYWDIKLGFSTSKKASLLATLTHIEGKRLDKFHITNEADATAIVNALKTRTYQVAGVEKKQVQRHPYAPFTTSSLQQDASRKLGFGASLTMQLAQKLYEGVELGGETVGLITYMRTDGVQVSEEAVTATRGLIGDKYGKEYLPGKSRIYKTKAKNAQEAHEAIRPTSVTRTPEQVRPFLDDKMFRLYELIWKRMVASQMESMVLDQVTVTIDSIDHYASVRVTGSTVRFDGFAALYKESKDEEEEEEDQRLPVVESGESLTLGKVTPAQHFTEPPPRYSEASLVKKMEELGIGRPSTYATIITVLQEREYVKFEKKRFIPEERGRLVTAFLTHFFRRYVEYDFTAQLEDHLDHISAGEMDWKAVLRAFWRPFSTDTKEVMGRGAPEIIEALNHLLEVHLFPRLPDGTFNRSCPSCHEGQLGLKVGKFGAFIACSAYPDCRYTRQLQGATDSEEGGAEGEDGANEPKVLGEDPKTKLPITLRKGPYGHYVQMGEAEKGSKTKPKRAPIPAGKQPADITLEIALSVLSLPREIGLHPETQKMISAGIGRFGPYLLHDGKYTSIPKGDDVLTIGMNRAVTVIAEKQAGKKAAALPLKVLGNHPETGQEVAVYDGRYGPYIKYGKSNIRMPKGETPDTVTFEMALKLIADQPEKETKKKKATTTRKKKE